jgi:hypothetical protein
MRCKTCKKIKTYDGPQEFAPLVEDYCDCSKVRQDLNEENQELRSQFVVLNDKVDELETELEISKRLNQDWIFEHKRVEELEEFIRSRVDCMVFPNMLDKLGITSRRKNI